MQKRKKPSMAKSRLSINSFALSAVAAAMVGMTPQSSYAQGDLEEIVVTGIRSSLERASDIKRSGKGVVDAISAEDIGKFPDSNLAESLQRITGVSIDRSNNEGNQITVRGFGPRFNLVTLNGRSMPTSVAFNSDALTRSFNFSELGSSSIAAVEVYKTGRADLPTGGIGSTVNIRTAKPFDYDGFKAVVNAKAAVDSTNVNGSDYTPDVSMILSNKFANNKLGLLAGLSYSARDSRLESVYPDPDPYQNAVNGQVEAGIDTSRNRNPDGNLYLIRNLQFETQDVERERVNGQFVLQYAPTDNIQIDLDYNLSRYDEVSDRNSTGFWFGFDGQRSGVSDENGLVNLRDNGNNIDLDAFGWAQDLSTENDSFGINVDWAVNDRLSFNLDAHNSVSESQPDGQIAENVINFRTPNVDFLSLDFNDGDIPAINYGASFDVFDTSLLLSDIAVQRGRQVKNEIEEVKLVGKYDFDTDKGLTNLTFGASKQDYTYDAATTFNFFFITDFDNAPVGITTVDRGSAFSDFSGAGPNIHQRLYSYDVRNAVSLATDAGFFGRPTPSLEKVEEETTSLFLSAAIETEISDMPLSINLGVRYEETDVFSQSGTEPIARTRLGNEAQIDLIRAEGLVFETLEDSYDFVLPSVDFKLDISDSLVARASYSETITRSNIGALTPTTRFGPLRPSAVPGAGTFTADQGNAGLQPALAESIDLSLEWYYKPGSYASLGLFSKDVSAFTINEMFDTTFPDVNGNPLTSPAAGTPRAGCPGVNCFGVAGDPEIIFEFSRLSNSDETGNVSGAELALQHVFENGFGVIANYTYTDGDIEFDLNNFDEQDPAPLTGLSDSANLVGFYENGPYQIRVAYNWRDEFLLSNEIEPVFTEEYSQIDFSASYDISDNFSVFIEGLNITDETTRSHGRSSRQLIRASSSGPRYAVGIRGSF